MTKKKFLILNRWDDEFAAYHKYIDHCENSVAYITTPNGIQRIDTNNAAVVKVLDTIEPSLTLFETAKLMANQLGGFDGIIALSEFDLLTAAELRQSLGVPGPKPNLVKRFKDKTLMKTAILTANLLAPLYVEASDYKAIASMLTETGFPIILKPKIGASSQNVYRIENQEQLNDCLSLVDLSSFECEQYITGSIYHIDGLVRQGVLQVAKPSRYINTCYDFAQGKPLGSVLMDPSQKTEKLVDFTDACLKALELTNGAFHLEVIENQLGDFYFLEIGARVGGGEIPFVYRDLFEIDLIGEWLRIEFDEPSINLNGAKRMLSGGFLMIPEPRNTPCQVVNTTSLINTIPEIYKEILPKPGDVLDGKGGYDNISGRFCFQGADEVTVESAIRKAIDLFKIQAVSISS